MEDPENYTTLGDMSFIDVVELNVEYRGSLARKKKLSSREIKQVEIEALTEWHRIIVHQILTPLINLNQLGKTKEAIRAEQIEHFRSQMRLIESPPAQQARSQMRLIDCTPETEAINLAVRRRVCDVFKQVRTRLKEARKVCEDVAKKRFLTFDDSLEDTFEQDYYDLVMTEVDED